MMTRFMPRFELFSVRVLMYLTLAAVVHLPICVLSFFLVRLFILSSRHSRRPPPPSPGDGIISGGTHTAGLSEAVVALELITCPLAVESLGSIVTCLPLSWKRAGDQLKRHDCFTEACRARFPGDMGRHVAMLPGLSAARGKVINSSATTASLRPAVRFPRR